VSLRTDRSSIAFDETRELDAKQTGGLDIDMIGRWILHALFKDGST